MAQYPKHGIPSSMSYCGAYCSGSLPSPATLSGAIDVIVVEQENGTLDVPRAPFYH